MPIVSVLMLGHPNDVKNSGRKMRILVVDPDEMGRQAVVTFLRSRFQAEAEEASCLEKTSPKASAAGLYCIIASSSGTSPLLKELEIPFLILDRSALADHSPFLTSSHYLGNVSAEDLEGMARLLESGLGAVQQIRAEAGSGYLPIATSAIESAGSLHVDLYIRISAERHLKVLNSDDVFSAGDRTRYLSKNVTHLYIRAEDAEQAIHALLRTSDCADALSRFSSHAATMRTGKQYEGLLEHVRELPQERLSAEIKDLVAAVEDFRKAPEVGNRDFVVSERTQRLVHSASQKFGMTPEVQSLIKASVNQALRVIDSNKALAALFRQKVAVNREHYFSARSVLLAHVACGIASLLDWKSDLLRYRLVLAAFLHDITLRDPQLAMIESVVDLALCRSSYTMEEIEAFEKHPETAAALVREITQIPPGVDALVAQHHEKSDGTGFPLRRDHRHIHSLSALFIVAGELVNYALNRHDGEWSIQEFAETTDSGYQTGFFKELYTVLSRAGDSVLRSV